MRNIRMIVLLLAVLPLQLVAQQKIQENTVSLDTVLNKIANNNLLLQTYALKAESFKHKAKAGTAWMAPMVGVGTYMVPYPGQQVMENGDRGALMLQLEQDIPNLGKLNAQKRYVESKSEVELAGRAIALNELKAQAKEQYYTWIVASKRIAVLQENDKIIKMMKKIEQIRYPYNQSQLSGVFKATAKIEENNNMIRMQRGDIAKAKAWLNGLMNLPGNRPLLIDSTFVPSYVAEAKIDTAVLAEQRKDILQMQESIHSMKLGIDVMKVQSKPDFKIRFDHMAPLSKMMPSAYSVMGMISIPIAPWSSKMYKSEVKAMNYEIQAMEKERAGMLQQSQGVLTGMHYEILSMQNRIAAMEKTIIPALKRTMDADFVNYQENKLELPAVIASWEALTMMQNNVLDEKLKLYKTIVAYEKELYR